MRMPIWPFGTLSWGDRETWEQRISSSAAMDDPEAALRKARATLTAILHENLLPFWTERLPEAAGADREFLAEERDGSRVVNLILVARYLWFVSRLVASAHQREIHRELAHRTYRLLSGKLHDAEHGGFFWEVDVSTGVANKPNKHLYGQAFAIFALAQYGLAVGSEHAIGLASSSFAVLERQAHDPELGGYREWLSRDWQPARGAGYLGWEARFKLVNTHLHLLEAFTGLAAAAPSSLLRSRVAELIEILSARTVSPRFGVALDCRLENWEPLRKRRNNKVSYGHDLETIYLLLAACDAIGADRDAIVENFRHRFAYCMRLGFDYENGGFFDHGPLGRAATSTTKIWWVQAEALLSALTMYRLTLERPYLAVFDRTLGWIQNAQIDWRGGEWHRNIEPDGRTTGTKIDRWKDPYHNGRAVLTCLDLIDELL